MNHSKRTFLTVLLLAVLATAALAKTPLPCPNGYYSNAEGKKQRALLTALRDIISSHTNVGYDGLWNAYADTDTDPNGYYIDMYSTYNLFTYSKKCGNYKKIGDCVNREHSFPSSWWGSGHQAQYSDIFHLYPTDGYVNNQRSNYPFGECANGTRLSNDGYVAKGKLGNSTFTGYTDKVFEPDDEYKGDFARSYFYLAAAYYNQIDGWTQGNGNAMIGDDNTHIIFNDYAVNLLMSWHRLDPVSEKEVSRNNAAYAWQDNRNPFIDHPELAEHIWGNLTNTAWHEGEGDTTPVITSPANGEIFDLGVTRVGSAISTTITIKGKNLTKALSVTITSGTPFTLSKTSISAADANAGTTLTVSFNSTYARTAQAQVTLSSSEVTTAITVKAQSVSGIPAEEATNITQNSFIAHWQNAEQSTGFYYLYVTDVNDNMLSGYPKQVSANALLAEVSGLQPATTYKYYLNDGTTSFQSNVVTVTTLDPDRILSIETASGTITILADVGEPSPVAEATVYTENIEDAVYVDINENSNFEISLDRLTWQKSLEIDPDGETFYIRIADTDTEGRYTATLSVSTATIMGNDVEVVGVVAAARSFLEDWEEVPSGGYYDSKEVQGTMCMWSVSNAGFWNSTSDHPHGSMTLRLGKNATSAIEMAEDKPNGAGTVTLYASSFGSDAAATFDLYYSTDEGTTWNKAGSFTTAAGDMQQFSFNINVPGNVRLKIQQTVGSRANIDDIAITDFIVEDIPTAVNTINNNRTWNAVAHDGRIIVNSARAQRFEIYDINAKRVASLKSKSATTQPLAPGVYVVTTDKESMKVIVK